MDADNVDHNIATLTGHGHGTFRGMGIIKRLHQGKSNLMQSSV